jgi:protein SCO1/2
MLRRLSVYTALAASLFGLSFTQGAPLGDPGSGLVNPAREYFTDTILIDQNSRPHRFYSDLIAGRTVIINEIFIGCSSSCPIVMARLAKLQELLRDRMGQVAILSISVDPVLDTPELLRGYAESFNAGPGWYFLTGQPSAVRTVLARFGERSAQPEDHNNIINIGNDATGNWIRLAAIATTEDIARAVIEVADDPAK